MARRFGRATSRSNHEIQIGSSKVATSAVWLCFCLILPSAAKAGLYTATDQIVIMGPENMHSVLNSSMAAMVVEFYASWCGHCHNFAPYYKELALTISRWKLCLGIAATDCANSKNADICRKNSVTSYPTVKYYHPTSDGVKHNCTAKTLKVLPRDATLLRHILIDHLETSGDAWPPNCPPLEHISAVEFDKFFETNTVLYLALIFEEPESYIGREVTLDMLQFANISVRRVLSTGDLVTKLGVTEFPSCYLYNPGGNFSRLQVHFEGRDYYTAALERLPGVVRLGKPAPAPIDTHNNDTKEPWRPFDRSRVYMADLESALHHSLRVELAVHTEISGIALHALKKFITVLVKYFPGRSIVMNLLESLKSHLDTVDKKISYEELREKIDNATQLPDTALPEGVRWVGCQSSQPNLRRYPCGVWTLFHVLTVQAMNRDRADPLEVLGAMRSYVRNFFGCKECARHFDNMARESMNKVNSVSGAVLWLWSRHNRVNNRLSGELTEDPDFPKIQWPSPDMCPSCHSVTERREHKWNREPVIAFLQYYFSSSRILNDYLEEESQILENQRLEYQRQQALKEQKHKRMVREALDHQTTTPLPSQEEEEEGAEEEAVTDQMVEGGEAAEMEAKPTHQAKTGIVLGRGQLRGQGKPSIVGMKMREQPEDIVDLDSFINEHYKAQALRMAASRVKQRTLQRKVEQDPEPMFGLGMELDAGLGMVGLQPVDTDFEPEQRKHIRKRDLSGQYFEEEIKLNHRKRGMMSALSIGFSKLDISLCVILYFLSCMCLLAMYLFFKNRLRLRRAKVVSP